jgi:hypothetical protein
MIMLKLPTFLHIFRCDNHYRFDASMDFGESICASDFYKNNFQENFTYVYYHPVSSHILIEFWFETLVRDHVQNTYAIFQKF